MKYLFYILTVIVISDCNISNIEITGTAPGKDGDVVSIINLQGATVFSASIKSGEFTIKKQLAEYGYYTLSATWGGFPHDFEIYLEPGKYKIDILQTEGAYPKIITGSKTQRSLSAYYNFEDSIMAKYRDEKAMWVAKLNDPKIKTVPPAEFSNILNHVESTRNREHGLHVAAMSMFISKYPQSDIVPHIITNMDYHADPYAYFILFQKLKPEVQNSEEGKPIGDELQRLVKQVDQQEKLNQTRKPYPVKK